MKFLLDGGQGENIVYQVQPNENENRDPNCDRAYLSGVLRFPDPLPFDRRSPHLTSEQIASRDGWDVRAQIDREFL
jgi:hypothetical protein